MEEKTESKEEPKEELKEEIREKPKMEVKKNDDAPDKNVEEAEVEQVSIEDNINNILDFVKDKDVIDASIIIVASEGQIKHAIQVSNQSVSVMLSMFKSIPELFQLMKVSVMEAQLSMDIQQMQIKRAMSKKDENK